MYFKQEGLPSTSSNLRVIWGHGWGQDQTAFWKLVEPLRQHAHHVLLDLPGFGQSPLPAENWGTADYADAVAVFLNQHPFNGKTIWVGHSFGCRVGLQLAARHPTIIDGLFLIAGAGLPRHRNVLEKLRLKMRIMVFKTLKRIWQAAGLDIASLRSRFGSKDYKSAGALRNIFVRVVSEDLSDVARRVACPTFLLYGSADKETPPDIGERLNQLISGSHLVVLEGQDHYSLLANGRHQTLKYLQTFMKAIIA